MRGVVAMLAVVALIGLGCDITVQPPDPCDPLLTNPFPTNGIDVDTGRLIQTKVTQAVRDARCFTRIECADGSLSLSGTCPMVCTPDKIGFLDGCTVVVDNFMDPTRFIETGYSLSMETACERAKEKVNLSCSNQYCLGCRKVWDCDCACLQPPFVSTEFVCACDVTGFACTETFR